MKLEHRRLQYESFLSNFPHANITHLGLPNKFSLRSIFACCVCLGSRWLFSSININKNIEYMTVRAERFTSVLAFQS